MYCKSFFDRKQFYRLYKRVFIDMARHNRQIVGAGSIQASTRKQEKFLETDNIRWGRENMACASAQWKEGSPQWKLQRYAMLPALAGAAQL